MAMSPTPPLGTPVEPALAIEPSTGEPSAIALSNTHHNAILKMTAEVFPGAKIELGTSIDPEIEGDEYFVVSVEAPGAVKELVARHGQWHRRMRAIIGPASSSYRLDLHVA
jgi:hypothetical protein